MNQQILKKNSFSEEKLKAKVPVIRVKNNFVMTEEPFKLKHYPNHLWLDILGTEICSGDDKIIKITIPEEELNIAQLFISRLKTSKTFVEDKFSNKMQLNRTYVFVVSDKIALQLTI